MFAKFKFAKLKILNDNDYIQEKPNIVNVKLWFITWKYKRKDKFPRNVHAKRYQWHPNALILDRASNNQQVRDRPKDTRKNC